MLAKWLLPLLFVTACSSAPVEQPQPPAEIPNKADVEKLIACGANTCSASAQRVEGGVPFAMYNMACVLQALQDRTPGSYGVTLNHTWGNGSETAEIHLRVLPSGDVMVATHTVLEPLDLPGSTPWAPVQRCSLVAPNVLDTCLKAVQMGQGPDATPEAWDCVFPDVSKLELPWFTKCVDAEPTCE